MDQAEAGLEGKENNQKESEKKERDRERINRGREEEKQEGKRRNNNKNKTDRREETTGLWTVTDSQILFFNGPAN